MINKFLSDMWFNAYNLNKQNILECLTDSYCDKLLDLGCDDGDWTLKLASIVNTNKIYGIEIVAERAYQAQKKGINVEISDLNNKLPYEDNYFDIIHANQVIEHVANLDHFMSEIYRILKKNGKIIISTENGSSWCNIFASIFGWQIFSLTNISSKKPGLGNPFALHKSSTLELSSWTHKTIFNYLGLKEFIEIHGFEIIDIKGGGYFPFPSWFGKIDVRHSHFLTVLGEKK